jgi:hypothetical protein
LPQCLRCAPRLLVTPGSLPVMTDKKPERRWLVSGVDQPYCALGLRVLLETISSVDRHFSDSWTPLVLCPATDTSMVADIFGDNSRYQVFPYHAVASDDRYRAKLSLKEFVDSSACDSDLILYLDYDHVCRNRIRLPHLVARTVFLSSEIGLLDRDLGLGIDEEDAARLEHTHFNTSLIFGSRNVLRAAMAGWEDAYNERLHRVPNRYREEVAFAVAATNAGICLSPVTTRLQGNWQNENPSCGLFHYGGEHEGAHQLKDYLRRASADRAASPPCINDGLAGEIVRLIARSVESEGSCSH